MAPEGLRVASEGSSMGPWERIAQVKHGEPYG